MREVVWAQSALDDADRIVAYVASQNAAAATRLADRLDEAARKLAAISTGRPGRVEGTRELPLVGVPYIVAYVEGASAVTIVRVIHTARNWPPHEWPPD